MVLADWWELGGLAMAEFYRALLELPDLQPDGSIAMVSDSSVS